MEFESEKNKFKWYILILVAMLLTYFIVGSTIGYIHYPEETLIILSIISSFVISIIIMIILSYTLVTFATCTYDNCQKIYHKCYENKIEIV